MAVDVMDFRGALVNDILPFWERSVDREYGGFFVTLDEKGVRDGDGAKHIVTTARMIYSYSLGYRLSKSSAHLEHARQGVEFFKQHFYDDRRGGWFRVTNRQGDPQDRTKYPYGIVFAIYALAEYYRASGDQSALGLAVETYDLYDKYAWDHEQGGIYFDLNEDWSIKDPTKTAGHLLHGMEAISSLYAATGNERYLRHLNRVCDILLTRTFDPVHGCSLETFTRDWQWMSDRNRGMALYGHIIEAAAFVSSVAAYTGSIAHLNFSRTLLGYVLRQGWDPVNSGICFFGRLAGGVVDSSKMWWVQSEGLSALSMAYRLTGDILYLDWLRKQAEFVYNKQRNPETGEWYMLLYADGTVRDGHMGYADVKYIPAKAAYHVVQGLYHAARNLADFEANGPAKPGAPGAKWEDFAL